MCSNATATPLPTFRTRWSCSSAGAVSVESAGICPAVLAIRVDIFAGSKSRARASARVVAWSAAAMVVLATPGHTQNASAAPRVTVHCRGMLMGIRMLRRDAVSIADALHPCRGRNAIASLSAESDNDHLVSMESRASDPRYLADAVLSSNGSMSLRNKSAGSICPLLVRRTCENRRWYA
jgi:hypothetical protein